jgi:hypothetical protein
LIGESESVALSCAFSSDFVGGPDISNGLNLGRGSKRNVRRIRWNYREILSFVVLMIVMSFLAVVVSVWFEAHHTD